MNQEATIVINTNSNTRDFKGLGGLKINFCLAVKYKAFLSILPWQTCQLSIL